MSATLPVCDETAKRFRLVWPLCVVAIFSLIASSSANMRILRLVLKLTLVFVSIVGLWAVQRALAAEVEKVELAPASPTKPISFRDRLIVGLEARLKNEVAFVDHVVEAVYTGHLPQRIVDQTFFWARQRSTEIRYGRPPQRPIIYFQPAMKARAKMLHVSL